MPILSWNRYGKSRIRVVKVRRGPGLHNLVDLTIDVQLEGAFDAVYVDGDNTPCVATDTMKNTVYAMARTDPIDHVETFACRLADHFVGKPAVSRARISAVEHRWDRLSVAGGPHPHAFAQPGGEQWTAVITRDGKGTDIVSGLTNLVVLKTTDSAFSGFPRDEYTTLPVADDRIREALVETFAKHMSRSLQETLYAMGEAALAACADATEITLTMPNRHHLLVDLEPFGLDNPKEVFVATDQPFGLMEATIRRLPT